MSEIIELIKVLRDRTGAGLMDCKKALVENNNDVEASISWLREKGILKVAKKSTRIAAEGLSNVLVEGNEAVIIEINSETDFVAHSDPFAELVSGCTKAILQSKPGCIDCAKEVKLENGQSIEESFTDATIKLGEKLSLRRFEIVEKTDNQVFGSYIHMKGKISVLVLLEGGDAELAKGISMSIAANNPQYLSLDDVTQESIDKETAIQTEISERDPNHAKKPADIQAKIITNRVKAVFAEQVLLLQSYVIDPSKTIAKVLEEKKAKVLKFYRYQVGEGLEKRQDDFVNEVMNQAK